MTFLLILNTDHPFVRPNETTFLAFCGTHSLSRSGRVIDRRESGPLCPLLPTTMGRTMARVAAFGLLCLTAGASAARVSPSALQLRSCAQAVVAEQKSSTMEWGAGLGPNAAAPLAGAALAGMLNAGVNKLGLRLRGGAKSKNHTNHNQNRKAHRNGIKRVKT